MSINANFITRTREDLLRLSHDLANNLVSCVLKPSEHPHIWSIYGSYMAGKSLIAETVASTLTGENIKGYFEDEPLIMGFQGTAHSYFDDRANRQYQFWDILSARPKCTPLERQRRQKEIISRISDVQEREGIIFIHNAPEAARKFLPAVEISITQKRKITDVFNPHARVMPCFNSKQSRDLNLRHDFKLAHKTAGEPAMIRLVQINIHNPDIFAEDFTKRLESGHYLPQMQP